MKLRRFKMYYEVALSLVLVLVAILPAHAIYPAVGGYVFTGTTSGITYNYGAYDGQIQLSGTGTTPATLNINYMLQIHSTWQSGVTIGYDGSNFSVATSNHVYTGDMYDGTYAYYSDVRFTPSAGGNLVLDSGKSLGGVTWNYTSSGTLNYSNGHWGTATVNVRVVPYLTHYHWIQFITTGTTTLTVKYCDGDSAGPTTCTYGTGSVDLVPTYVCSGGGTLVGNQCVCNGPTTVSWTDPTITANTTKIRKTHIDELRSQIDTRRIDAGLAAYPWTDATIVAGSTKIRKTHFDEMRTAIRQVYTACGQAAPSFTDPTITANTTSIRSTHITELRNAVNNAK